VQEFPTFADAYRGSLERLLAYGEKVSAVTDPLSPGSRFGAESRDTLELPAYSFRITHPSASLIFSPARSIRLAYCLGSLIWSLNGSDNLEEIAYYNPRGREFSDDGVHLSGAFGKRLLNYDGQLNQIDYVVEQLKHDPATRRAVALILAPADNATKSREYPCAVSIQYLLRGGRLHSITYMRSQSAAMVLPYDVFLFCSIQCLIAQRIGVETGHYHHFSGSFHMYLDEINLAQAVLREEIKSLDVRNLFGSPFQLTELKELERSIRTAAILNDLESLHRIEQASSQQPGPLRQFAIILLLHAYARLGMFKAKRHLSNRLENPFNLFMTVPNER
jgi:thymidylate synthase